MNTVTCYTCGKPATFNEKSDRWVHTGWEGLSSMHKVTGPPPTRSADRLADGAAANDYYDRERYSR